MSIATMRGDGGQTGLSGGIRVSKSSPRVEAYGTLDELISSMGFARSICPVEELRIETKQIQKELFKVTPEDRVPLDELPLLPNNLMTYV